MSAIPSPERERCDVDCGIRRRSQAEKPPPTSAQPSAGIAAPAGFDPKPFHQDYTFKTRKVPNWRERRRPTAKMPYIRKGDEYPTKSGIIITPKVNPSGSKAYRVDIPSTITGMFAFALTEGYCTTNPIAKIALFHVPEKAPSILTVEQSTRLIITAADTESKLGLLGYPASNMTILLAVLVFAP